MMEKIVGKLKRMPPRLAITLGCYLILLVVGLVLLLPVRTRDERFVLGFFLAVFVFFTWKTIFHARKGS